MTQLAAFLLDATGISLSGVMQPGALTAATVSAGTRYRWAGAWTAIGHGLVELPLILLIVHGLDEIIQRPKVRIGIGLAGGVFLLVMAVGVIHALCRPHAVESKAAKRRSPLMTGMVLSAANPFFLVWWATVGLALAVRAEELGIMAFALFAAIHWTLDLIWLTALSWTTFKGGRLLAGRAQQIVLGICAVALLYFGGKFLFDASGRLIDMLRAPY